MAPAARYEADTRGGDGSLRQELAARIAGGIQRANHLLGAAIAGRSWNITDATPKVIAVAKVRANIVIHICSSIAWQAGARPVSQPPAPGTEPQPSGRSVDPWRKKPRSQAVHPPTLANLVRTLSKYSEMDQRENCPTCGSSKQYPGAIAEEILLRLFSAQPSRYRSSKSLQSSASWSRL